MLRKLSSHLTIQGLALVSLVLPYRLLYHNRSEVASWKNESCYVTGESAETLLLFCPDLPVRNHAVARTDVARSGSIENIFTRFGPAPKP